MQLTRPVRPTDGLGCPILVCTTTDNGSPSALSSCRPSMRLRQLVGNAGLGTEDVGGGVVVVSEKVGTTGAATGLTSAQPAAKNATAATPAIVPTLIELMLER